MAGKKSKTEFDWRKIFIVTIDDEGIKKEVTTALDRIAATPSGREIMNKAQDGAVQMTRDELAAMDKDREISPFLVSPLKSNDFLSGMRSQYQETRRRLVDRLQGKDYPEPGVTKTRIEIRAGEPSAFMAQGQVITYDAAQVRSGVYAGIDGLPYPYSPERVLAHEIGHGAQKKRLADIIERQTTLFLACNDMDKYISHKKPDAAVGENGAGTPSPLSAKCKAAREADDEMALKQIEQPNVDRHENRIMREIDRSSRDRGRYEESWLPLPLDPSFSKEQAPSNAVSEHALGGLTAPPPVQARPELDRGHRH